MKTPHKTTDDNSRAKSRAKAEFDRFMALPDAQKTKEAEATARKVSQPLSRDERAMFDDAGIGRRRGRPVKGRGSQRISVTVEKGLLERVDRYAHDRGATRAQIIAQAMQRLLA